ncbi:LOW QUALITY PROTEIN: hypothetical protein QC762_512530 [Podospora pseudocomata]|uniref:C2H2-type domain-containing protein n=1 Tax=Podospora pseudocomata TaxID=2093779 RepID=A0ABR0GC58_9PEZI|nr:LOW QUALITY PROTEIN: hypothetical protein QC762_512530 [Podospora pseudocomata]
MDFDNADALKEGTAVHYQRHATVDAWVPWNQKKMGRLPPTPSSTPDSAAMQHRQSTSIDSAVVLKDNSFMYGVSSGGKSPPATPSPISTPSSPGCESDESNEWDRICIGQKDGQDASVKEIQEGMGAVSLMLPAEPTELEQDMNDVDYHSEVTAGPDNDAVTVEEADHILICLPTLRGINSSDVPREILEACKVITYAYAEQIAAIVDSFEDFLQAPVETDIPSSGAAGTLPQRPSSSQIDKSTGKGKEKPKANKKRRLSDEENDQDDEEESGSIMGDPRDSGEERNSTASKLRCIFRARNPSRFNVRDHTSCAMTMFTKFSDLRKHILNKHMADSEIVTCQQCKKGFPSGNALELHCEQEPCNYTRSDPEDGINSETASQIRFRSRDCGPSDEDQWKHLWQLAFPEDPDNKTEPFHFVPVLEHHELEPAFIQKLEYLKPVVQSYVPDEEQFEGLCVIIKSLFESAVHDLTHIGLKMDYVNRQGSRTNNRISRSMARVLWSNVHDRESGIGLDSSETATPRTSARYPSVALETTRQGQQDRSLSSGFASIKEPKASTLRVRSQLGATCSFTTAVAAKCAHRLCTTRKQMGWPAIPNIYILGGHNPWIRLLPCCPQRHRRQRSCFRLLSVWCGPNVHGTIHIDPAQLQFSYQQPHLSGMDATMNNGIAGYTAPAMMNTLTGTRGESGQWI